MGNNENLSLELRVALSGEKADPRKRLGKQGTTATGVEREMAAASSVGVASGWARPIGAFGGGTLSQPAP